VIEKISAAFLSSFGRLNNDKLQSISPAVAGANFGSKCGAKQTAVEQSVAHYTSQAKLWALRGCEPTNKTVGRDYLHTLLNENKNKFQEENHHFIFSVSYGEIP